MEGNRQVDCVVKLGGSAITHKATFETAKLEEIQQAAQLIMKAKNAGLRVVVVHGAGSFGHQVAAQYKVNRGYEQLESEAQRKVKGGFSATRVSVCKLNQMIIREFVEAGLPAVGLSGNKTVWRQLFLW